MQIQEPAVAIAQNTERAPDTQSWHLVSWGRAALAVLPMFVLTRFIFLILSYFGGVLFTVPNFSSIPVSYHDLLYSWNRWDTMHYLDIAANGYVKPENAFFFPLYPTLLRTFAPLFRHNLLITGLLLSNVFFFCTLIVFYRLVEREFDRETAKRAALYLAIFPTAFFFFAAYSESLFLLLVLLCFYALRRKLWWLAGLFGALATLTRIEGLFLFVIFVCEFVRQVLPQLRQAWQKKQTVHTLHTATGLLAGLLIPLALGVYAYALHVAFGNPFAFISAQKYWTAGITAPWEGPLIAVKGILRLPHLLFTVPHDIIDLTALLLFLALLLLCFVGPVRFARNQWTFALFGLLLLFYALLLPGIPAANGLSYDPLPSMERFVLSIFPGFILLARFGRRLWFHQGYLLLVLPLLAFFVLQFLTGHWTV